MIHEVIIRCTENSRDFITFQYEPGCSDGMPAGIDANTLSDGSITLTMDELIQLRDACNKAIETQE